MAVYAATLVVGACGVGALLAFNTPRLPPVWALVGLAALTLLAERQGVQLTASTETSVSFLPIVFAAVSFGPLTAALIAAAANVGNFGKPYGRWIVYTPIRFLTGAAAGLAALALEPQRGSTFGVVLVAALVAAAANLIADAIFNVLTLAVRRSRPPQDYIRAVGPLFAVALPLYVPVVALLIYGYWQYSFWVVGAFLASAVAMQRLVRLYQDQREATKELGNAYTRLERANLSFATALVAALDARDGYTAGHSAAVAVYSKDIAARLGLSEQGQQLAHLCGLVHDIGKVGLPPGLLEKAGPLSLEERRQMQEHPAIGERILAKVETYSEIADVVRHHHERVDGHGYPDGLAGESIPLLARIIAVADAYNAMTSDRPYRDAMPSRVARLRLAQAVESQFDTTVVAAFEAILAGATEDYRQGSEIMFRFDGEAEVAPRETAAAERSAIGL